MTIVHIPDDNQDITVKITIQTPGLWDYDYKHHDNSRFNKEGGPSPDPETNEHPLRKQNIGKSDFWTIRVFSIEDRNIDYDLHVEWWQGEKLVEEWVKSGTISKSAPVKPVLGEAKFRP